MSGGRQLTLPEVARLLGQKQHRLIHLCERAVVVPDLAEARGRGSSRRFSERNLLEFAVALRLRDTMIPVGVVGAVIRVLRAFEREVAREIRGFELPRSLQEPKAPELRIVLSDGVRLFFTLGSPGKRPRVFDGIDIRRLRADAGRASRAPKAVAKGKSSRLDPNAFGAVEGSQHVRIEVNVTQIARDLPSE